MNRIWLVAFVLVTTCAQPSPRRRSPPYDDRRRSFDDRRRTFDDRRRWSDDRRRWDDDRRRYMPSPPPPPPPPPCLVPNCQLCIMPTMCLRCKAGYTGSGVIGMESCDPCAANCKSCDTAGAGNCDAKGCQLQFTYVNGTCEACSSSCDVCDSAGPGDCDEGKCISGYANNRTGSGCGRCTPNCCSCQLAGAANCDARKCFDSYTNNGSSCSACASSCESCNTAGAGLCDTCKLYYFVNKDRTCAACAEKCMSCTDSSHNGCSECSPGFEFNRKHECVEKWDLSWMIPAGFAIFCLIAAIAYITCTIRRPSAREGEGLLRQQQMSVRSSNSPSLPTQPIWQVPSGAWRGYYTYGGRNHDVCEFQLHFENGDVQGRGVDDVGAYSIVGKFNGRSHAIRFTKQYQRGTRNQAGIVSEDNEGHAVIYTGRLVGENLGAGFRGSWSIRNWGTNSDGVFHLWPAMDSWGSASAPPLEEPTPQVFQVAEDGECVVCLDRRIATCLRPCGHIAMCSQCADRLKRSTGTCPICRTHIQSVLTMQNCEVHPSAAQALRT